MSDFFESDPIIHKICTKQITTSFLCTNEKGNADQARDRTRFGIGVEPAFALKMLLLFKLVSRLPVVVPALLPIVVVLLDILTLFFEGGVPSKPLLGAFGVNFLRVLFVVYMPLQDNTGAGSGFVEVVEVV